MYGPHGVVLVATPARRSLYELESMCIHMTYRPVALLKSTFGRSTIRPAERSPLAWRESASACLVQCTRSVEE